MLIEASLLQMWLIITQFFYIHRIPMDKETEVYFIKRIYSLKNKQAFLESIAETD